MLLQSAMFALLISFLLAVRSVIEAREDTLRTLTTLSPIRASPHTWITKVTRLQAQSPIQVPAFVGFIFSLCER
ncbi:MAG: hypothetical protein WCA22_06720 [Candidatus Binatus sp.]